MATSNPSADVPDVDDDPDEGAFIAALKAEAQKLAAATATPRLWYSGR